MLQNNKTPQTETELKQAARLDYIENNLLLMTQEEMATALQVSRQTIVRDLERWKENGGFKRFLTSQFVEKYAQANRTEKPLKLLDRVITMMCKLAPDTTKEVIEEIKLSLDDGYIMEKAREIEVKRSEVDGSYGK